MARGVVPLSDTKIRQAKPREKPYKLFDGGGLYLYVSPKGAKSWRMKYRHPVTKKDQTITFGLYPGISLKRAREMREEVRSALIDGLDPKCPAGEEVRFRDLATEWLDLQKIGNKHRRFQRGRLDNHINPRIGDLPIDKITRRDVARVLTEVYAAGKEETAGRLHSIITSVLRYAVARGLIEHNVAADIDRATLIPPPEKKHLRTITNPKEIGHFVQAVKEYPGYWVTSRALLLQLYTATRPGEARGMRWDEIDGDLWHIPAHRMKMKRPHTVPLSVPARQIIEEMRGFCGDSEFVFPSPFSKTRPISNNTVNVAIKRIGYGDKLVAHGLRSMFSTIAHEQSGFPHEVIEAQLAHATGSEVSRAYNRAEYLDERRKLVEWWAGWLEGLA
ncbi:tyrosine-type recombinase/integrase [Nitratifractor salsuginis]|uniref:Integrase family protein n=1 Tax=Nitratifractor salsuginis (strain DSM 16511 / JCM 12458 / E9I37-1) TaxID=749222 RepID=E6X1L5_NITSE|nr:integrase arm-type DNA-binding domain-containing protein [Nitratifractor salsuginis]ADV47006.1 integrase family protein [Nitratifractor salsuginis DSM 16511]